MRFTGKVRQILTDERGGEVLEYAFIASMIVALAVVPIGCVGTKLLAKWNSLGSSM